MKNTIFYFALVSLCFLITADKVFAQAPQRMSYQAVVRDGSGNAIDNATVGIRVSILQGSQQGSAVYVERHTASTNANGLVSIQIGGGIAVTGTLQAIDWSQGPHFIKSETDPQGGTSYSITGVSEMLSVPYALFAANGGVPGPQGPQGPEGAAGPEGPQGVAGETGNGIKEVTDNGSGQLTFHFDDGSTYATPDLTGPEGPPGDQDLSGYLRIADLPTAVPANEADPDFASSVAVDITAADVERWDVAFGWGDHAIEGYLERENQGLGDVLAAGTNAGNAALTNVSKISVGGEGTEPSAIVELTSTDKGFLPPRMGDASRDAIVNPAQGLIIFNTNAGRPQFFDGQAWHNLDGTVNAPVGNSYYVSVNNPIAQDAISAGTRMTPFRSISYAMQRAGATGIKNIIVAKGTYNETITLPSGINLFGGYEDYYWVRFEGDNAGTVIRGVSGPAGHAATIVAQSVTQPTTLNGLTIVGQNAQTAGRNSYAIYVNNSPGLIISDNFIIAGSGANGVTGAPGVNGQNGINGANGAVAFEASGTGECDLSNNRPGAAGGSLTVGGMSVSGGSGGGNQCPAVSGTQSSSQAGLNGSGSSGGGGGVRAYDAGMSSGQCLIPAGSRMGADGRDGGNGSFGSGGGGATNLDGAIVASHWLGISGTNGAPGNHGGGGGGGSSGGGAECLSGCTYALLGGTGGGGGSGAGGGSAGGGGGGGGSSFGIFIVNGAKPMILNNHILLGSGGNGGYGGYGGTGGAGARGGLGGGSSYLCAQAGGKGGNGGDGGHGGGGGGGAGGNAYGIFTHNVTGSQDYLSADSNNNFFGGQSGQGGSGGKSLGNEGTNGVIGKVELVR